MKKSYELDMTTGAILPKMLQFCFPLMFTGILQLLFNAADVFVVGKYVEELKKYKVQEETDSI